jgi:hypothetical protein
MLSTALLELVFAGKTAGMLGLFPPSERWHVKFCD